MAVAALLVLISFMGFCGAATRNTVLLKGFIFFVTFLLLVKIAIVVLLFVMQDEIRPTLTKLWNNSKDTNRVEFQRVFSSCKMKSVQPSPSYGTIPRTPTALSSNECSRV